MTRTTPVTIALGKLGIGFELRVYEHGAGGPKSGLQAADVLGEPPHLVLKTLMLQVDGRPVCALVPSDRQVSMKKVAAARGQDCEDDASTSAAALVVCAFLIC